MVKLSALELAGFKSFAERTRVRFTDGVTAIVGPNGCGKSNLSDAIGFVLGLQTARNLRGQKMEDFIFGGTRKRKPSGLAEVSLTLQMTGAQTVAIEGVDLDSDEIEITRKLYRSGESVYLINQKRCRLMDIHRFLEEAGLGFSGYAMIAQGKIESFLNAKPMDRRALIEEAAQITGYKAKRRSAELKLEMAQQNLLRVSDIILEVERQLRTLKRQAGKTRRYRRLREEFRRLQRQRFRVESARLGGLIGELRSRLRSVSETELGLKAELRDEEERHSKTAAAREELEQELSRLQEQDSSLTLRLDRARNAVVHNRKQIEELTSSLNSFGSEREALQSSLLRLDEELERHRNELEGSGDEQRRLLEKLNATQASVEEARGRVEEMEKRLEEARSKLVAVAAESASARNQKELGSQRLARLEADLNRTEESRGQSLQGLENYRTLAAERRKTLAGHREQLGRDKLAADTLRQEVDSRSRELQELREEETSLRNQLVALRERFLSLQELEMSRAQYSEGVKKVLSHLNRNHSITTSGTLADSVETSPEFERVVEEFLDEELEYILVDSLDEAVRGVSEVRNLKSGKCTFLSLLSSNGFGKDNRRAELDDLPGPDAGVFGRLSDLLKMKPGVDEAFLRVFPQQADAIVVSDMDRAMHLAHSYPESTFITLSGESLLPRGLVSASASGSSKLGLLSVKRQRRELEKKVEQQLLAVARIEDARTHKDDELREKRLQLEESLERLYRLEKESIRLEHEVRQSEADLQRLEKELNAVEAERGGLEAEIGELKARVERAAAETAACDEQRRVLESELDSGRNEYSQLRGRLSEALATLSAVASERNVFLARKNSLASTIERIAGQRRETSDRLEASREREARSRDRITALNEETVRLSEEIKRLEGESREGSTHLADQQKQLTACKGLLHSIESRLNEVREKLASVQGERSEIEVALARLETQLAGLNEQCEEQLNMPLSQALEGLEEVSEDAEEIGRRYEQLKRRLESFGPINMTALKEYQEAEERYQFLTAQKQDIEQSISDTTQAIQEINRRSQIRFSEAFEAVNRNFQEVFAKLFGGGECGMRLLDEEDVLECGIDLFAQPPGKKLQNVMLLSGGEKALTVFALLVGVFMYRPSRFCILDEVDAPLDDANVKRFAGLVQEMAEQTQFIIVTHNKRTMENANSMYGVTMEEAGISKVVSAQF